MKHLAAIALGSNLSSANGDRRANLLASVERIGTLGTVVAVSTFFDTAPVGFVDQPRFLNAALLLETTLQPIELLNALLDIEKTMGRDRSSTVPKGPRVIDLDLVLCDDLILDTPTLQLPHPAMRERRFVLEPLAEIVPQRIDPVTGLSMAELLARLQD